MTITICYYLNEPERSVMWYDKQPRKQLDIDVSDIIAYMKIVGFEHFDYNPLPDDNYVYFEVDENRNPSRIY
jgi:hypothetical protein